MKQITLPALVAATILSQGCIQQSREEQQEQEYQELIREADEAGILEVVPYRRPDDQILTVWESLVSLNCGNDYAINGERYTLVYEGNENTFRYDGWLPTKEIRTPNKHGISSVQLTGGFSGNPYKDPLTANSLRKESIREFLIIAYEQNKNKFSCK